MVCVASELSVSGKLASYTCVCVFGICLRLLQGLSVPGRAPSQALTDLIRQVLREPTANR